MKLALLALAGLFFFAAPMLFAQGSATLHTSTPEVETTLQKIISQQLAAFGAGDFVKAYGFAAGGIQKMFPQPAFEKMVRGNYPIMLTSPKTDFGVALDDGQQGIVFVELTGGDGPPEVFRYLLTHEAGGWKINGVEQVEKGGSGKPQLTA